MRVSFHFSFFKDCCSQSYYLRRFQRLDRVPKWSQSCLTIWHLILRAPVFLIFPANSTRVLFWFIWVCLNVYALYPGWHHLLLIGISVIVCTQQHRTSRDWVKYKDTVSFIWLFLCGSIWTFTSHSTASIHAHPLPLNIAVRRTYCESYWTRGRVLYHSSQKYAICRQHKERHGSVNTSRRESFITKKCMWILEDKRENVTHADM